LLTAKKTLEHRYHALHRPDVREAAEAAKKLLEDGIVAKKSEMGGAVMNKVWCAQAALKQRSSSAQAALKQRSSSAQAALKQRSSSAQAVFTHYSHTHHARDVLMWPKHLQFDAMLSIYA
jgi:predicted alpha/beta superfamily hydrolase